MKRISMILIPAILTGCVARPLVIEHPEWVPEKGIEWAKADCNAEAAKAGGFGWVEEISNNIKAYDLCLAKYGVRR